LSKQAPDFKRGIPRYACYPCYIECDRGHSNRARFGLIRVSELWSARLHRAKRGAKLVACLRLSPLLCAALAASAPSQTVLSPRDTALANRIWDESPKGEPLRCDIDKRKPLPDFTFHFDAGYRVTCSFWEFGGQSTHIDFFTRVTPEGGAPVWLATFGVFKGLSPGLILPDVGAGDSRTRFDVSGSFSVGEGRYRVDVLVVDERNRSRRGGWNIHVTPRQQAKVPVVLAAHTVSPVEIPKWAGPTTGGARGLRLTVLLDAAPVNPSALTLRAWDQALLLQLLSSLLRQTPCKSVRLVAFNLDQQREIFRADPFEPSGFDQLQQAFQQLELGFVSVQVLKKRQGWAEMLADLTNRELTAHEPSDAVLFLGPETRFARKVPKELLKPRETPEPRFFYFEYRGSVYPDSITYLTKSRHGSVWSFYDPHGLAQAIQKMLAQLKPEGERAEAKPSAQGPSP